MNTQQKIVKIVITGGPCGGKSTALTSITQALDTRGWKTFIAHEMATRFFQSGVEISDTGISLYEFQEQLILRQIDEEDFVQLLASKHHYDRIVILCDRGTMDGQAYMSEVDFDNILRKNNYTRQQMKVERYDFVLHLTTAAYGAEKFYTLENNHTRKETIAEARALDDKTKAAWMNHPNRLIITNDYPFQQKIEKTIQEIVLFLDTTI